MIRLKDGQLTEKNLKNILISAGIILVISGVLIAGIYLLFPDFGQKGLPVSVPGATCDVTQKYAGYDFGITPTVKSYGNAVFDIEEIRSMVETENAMILNIDGIERRIVLQKTDTCFSGALPDFVSYTGTGDGKFYQHISIGEKSLILWIMIDGVSYYIDTTNVENETGRLVHYIYTSRDTGWSKEHKDFCGYTLTPIYMGDNRSEINGEVYDFSESDFDKFPVVGRFLKYGAGNLELTNREAEDIRSNFRGKSVHYNGHFYGLIFATA